MSEQINDGRAPELSIWFHTYCKQVIKNQVKKQINDFKREYDRIIIPYDESADKIIYDENLAAIDKYVFTACGEKILLEDETMAKAIMELRSDMRTIILLNIVLDYSMLEISDLIDMRYNTVKSYHSRAIHKLRKIMGGSADGKEETN